ncbi:hypothetical protein CTEN210_08816 [Chaetoceros tenuissimus]|uniref:MYND-type domain-containing protein n=1 Tax=Chaetoceros tenuissimus TaxID=426638 RepID=A0AAD3H6M0_9STRA|nr:hypothetical protein CTEN210_08816 [Chaetoceros tenuissimus]
MSSEPTVNPTNICAACQKEGATKRCRGCLDVDIETFYCSRECQVKHWKTHKTVCRNNSTTGNSTADNSSDKRYLQNKMKELRGYDESVVFCENCGRNCADVGCKLKVCSKCEFSHYCSRECQVASWPRHKETCKQIIAYEEVVSILLSPAEARIRNLLELQWKRKALFLLHFIVNSALTKKEREQQPPTKVVSIVLEFNYNAKTFVLAEEPKAIPISGLDEEKILAIYHQEASDRKCVQIAYVTCTDFGEKLGFYQPTHFAPGENYDRHSMLFLQTSCLRIHLKSDLFQNWTVIRERNLQNQIEYMKQSPSYSMFLRNALQLFSEKPLHLTHGIKIFLKLGKVPGKIAEMLEYKVKLLTEIRDQNNNIAAIVPKHEREFLAKNEFDVHNDPRLLEARKRDPNSIMIAISFQNVDVFSPYWLDSVILPLDSSGKVSVKKCKKDANKCFKQLQGVVKQMPSHLLEKVNI